MFKEDAGSILKGEISKMDIKDTAIFKLLCKYEKPNSLEDLKDITSEKGLINVGLDDVIKFEKDAESIEVKVADCMDQEDCQKKISDLLKETDKRNSIMIISGPKLSESIGSIMTGIGIEDHPSDVMFAAIDRPKQDRYLATCIVG